MPRASDLIVSLGGQVLQETGALVRRTATWEDVPETFARASVGYMLGRDSLYRPAEVDALRVEWLDLDGDGIRETAVLLLEDTRTNELTDSSHFEAAGSDWAGPGNFTITEVAGALVGQSGWKHLNGNSGAGANRSQIKGVLTSAPETFSVIIENVDAVTTDFGIYDLTAGDWVVRAEFTWATGAIIAELSGVGSAASVTATLLAGTGPNGGALYRITCTSTPDNSGNSRTLFVYPSGDPQNALTVIIHHAQHEEAPFASSPISTVATAVARAAETLSNPFNAVPQEMTVYPRFIETGTQAVSGSRVFEVGAGALADPFITVRGLGAGLYRADYSVNGTVVSTGNTAAIAIGEAVEMAVTLNTGSGVVGLSYSINGAAVVAASDSSAQTETAPTAWSGPKIWPNSSGASGIGFIKLLELLAVRGTKTIPEMRAY